MIDDEPAPARPSPQPGRRSNQLLRRLLTAAVGIPILLALIGAGGPVYVAAVAIILALGAEELYHAAGLRWSDPLAASGVLAVAAMAATADLRPDARWGVLTTLVVLCFCVVVVHADVQTGFTRWTAVVGGAVYVGVLGSYLVPLRMLDEGRAWVLLMLFTTFATDTGAYFIGRALGRRKLAPRVSPGKTVAGAVGGLASGGVVAVVLNALLALDAHPAAALGLGVGAAVAAEMGDLAESLFKRSLGVKDMGRLFPGHGGALDRLDSILFTAPVVYWVARWISA